MRVAFVSDSVYPFNKGGKETRSFELAVRMARKHDVDFYTMGSFGKKSLKGVNFFGICKEYPLYKNWRRSFFQALLFGVSAFKIFFKKFDVVDADQMVYFHLLPLWLATKIRRKRFVVTWHEVWGRDYWKKYLGVLGVFGYFFERLSVRLADRIISVSDKTSEGLVGLGVSRERIWTIPNGVDFGFVDSVVEGEKSDVIFVGRLVNHKRVDLLIRAVSVLKESFSDIRCFIVGDGPERRRLEELASELGVLNNVFFKGRIEKNEDVLSLIKSSKVLVLPSEREGFGIVVLEANACGIPVVCSSCESNAAKFLIREEENGALFKCGNFASLADALVSLFDGGFSRRKCKDFAKRFDWENLLDKFEEVYFK